MSDRDTHFLSFAELLFREIKDEWDEDLSFDATLHKIIARRAYDFSCHVAMQNTLVAHHDMSKISDLTEWPKQETNE